MRTSYFCQMVFIFLSFFLLSSPNLSGRRLDVCHTSTHDVALVRIWNACLKCAARSSRETQDAKNRRLRTIASGYIFATKACIDNRKNLLNSYISPTRPHSMVNFDPLTAEICSGVWGTPANFNEFRILAALLHGTPVVGVNQTLRRWTEGATYNRNDGHHVGHWPTF